MDRALRRLSNMSHQEQNTSCPYLGDFRTIWEVLCVSRAFRLRQTFNWSLFVYFPLFAGLPSFNCLEEVLCPGCCFRLIFYSLNLPCLFFFFFPSSSVLSRRNKENLGVFFQKANILVREIYEWCQVSKAENSSKKNISCSDCHKKELFVVFFMLLFKAAKLICNKL